MRFRDKLLSFLMTRNGMDGLNMFLGAVIFFVMIVNAVLRLCGAIKVFLAFSLLEFLILGYLFFRYFSKRSPARRKENEVFMRVFRKVLGYFKLQKTKFRDRKTHVFRRCPHCHANLRLPKEKGKHQVRCPRCGVSFDVKV